MITLSKQFLDAFNKNSNSNFIRDELTKLGFEVKYKRTISTAYYNHAPFTSPHHFDTWEEGQALKATESRVQGSYGFVLLMVVSKQIGLEMKHQLGKCFYRQEYNLCCVNGMSFIIDDRKIASWSQRNGLYVNESRLKVVRMSSIRSSAHDLINMKLVNVVDNDEVLVFHPALDFLT